MQATRNQYSTPQHHYRNATTAAAATSANAATIRRRTLSHVSRSYSLGTSAANAAATAAANAAAASAAATPATSSASSNNQLSIHKTGIMVAASRCRSPIMLCHSHSDGEFPLYRGESLDEPMGKFHLANSFLVLKWKCSLLTIFIMLLIKLCCF